MRLYPTPTQLWGTHLSTQSLTCQSPKVIHPTATTRKTRLETRRCEGLSPKLSSGSTAGLKDGLKTELAWLSPFKRTVTSQHCQDGGGSLVWGPAPRS